MDRDQILERAKSAHDRGATELHIVGGLHHKLPFDYYVDLVRWIKDDYPEIHIKAYTGVEIEFFAKIARLSIREVLQKLVDAGLGSLPGGGAEIFHPEVREQVCGAKASTEVWLEVHRTAHQLGLHSNATMLYGHIDKAKHRIDHLVRLRELQDETGGFQTFIPLAFHPDNSRMDEIPKPSGVMDLKTMAISRLMLDNFPHIKAYWVMLGIKTAQVALVLRGRRHRRDRRPRDDLPRGRGRDPAGDHRQRDPPPDHRGRPDPRRARHPLPQGRARRGPLDQRRGDQGRGAGGLRLGDCNSGLATERWPSERHRRWDGEAMPLLGAGHLADGLAARRSPGRDDLPGLSRPSWDSPNRLGGDDLAPYQWSDRRKSATDLGPGNPSWGRRVPVRPGDARS